MQFGKQTRTVCRFPPAAREGVSEGSPGPGDRYQVVLGEDGAGGAPVPHQSPRPWGENTYYFKKDLLVFLGPGDRRAQGVCVSDSAFPPGGSALSTCAGL